MIHRYLRQIILFLSGFCIYITIEVCFRGFSYPVMGLCGGILLLMLDQLNERISWNLDLLLQGILGSVMVTAAELIVGELWKWMNWPPMWDYTDMPFNFDGVICLPFSLAWIGVSILGVIIADAINYYVFCRLPIPSYKLFGKTILTFKQKPCELAQSSCIHKQISGK